MSNTIHTGAFRIRSKYKKWTGILFAIFAAITTPVLAQNGPPGGGGGPGGFGGPGGGPGGGPPNFAEHRQHELQDIQDDLDIADDKWKALQPKIEKLMDLHDQLSPHGGPPRRDQDDKEPSAIREALDDLRQVIDDKNPKPEEVQAKVDAYEKAKAKTVAEMKAAEEELKTGLTPLQQAILIAHGVLD